MTLLARLSGTRELFVALTLRELRGKYKRSLLGWAWSLLNPVATMAIFALVFQFFLKIPVPRGDPSGIKLFAFYLLCGLLPWNFLSNGMNGSMLSFIGNANLIKKVYFPRGTLVAANVASWGVSLLIEMGVLAAAVLLTGHFVLPWLVPLVLVAGLQAVFIVGIGLLLGVLNVYFRDVQHLVSIFTQVWFYATPIIYPITIVPERAHILGAEFALRDVYGLNPMTAFVEAYRDCLYDLRFPSATRFGYLILVSGVMLAIGLAVFRKLEPRLAEEL
jgi:ABC-2 type transport system permease protein